MGRIRNCKIGKRTKIGKSVDLYCCHIGEGCKIHSFTYIEAGVKVGDRCIIKPHCFLPTGIIIEDEVFLGPHVVFVNDRHPKANTEDWKLETTRVRKGASIGAGAVIMCGVKIGEEAIVGAGSVVVEDVEAKATVVGNPAKRIR